eukprot:9284509-Lingulodinium_polyedra.AAC.1
MPQIQDEAAMEPASTQDFPGTIPYKAGSADMFRIYVDEGCRCAVRVVCSKFAEEGHVTSPARRRRAE